MKYKDMSPDEKEDAQIVFFFYASFIFMVIITVLIASYLADYSIAMFVSILSWFFLIQFFFLAKYKKYYLPVPNGFRTDLMGPMGWVVKSKDVKKDIIILSALTLVPISVIVLLNLN